MTAAALPRTIPARVTLKSLRTVLHERGLQLQRADRDQLVARWPVSAARVVHDGRQVVVLSMDEKREWRGVLLVGSGANGFELRGQATRFRDLLHFTMWLDMHAPQRVARVAEQSAETAADESGAAWHPSASCPCRTCRAQSAEVR